MRRVAFVSILIFFGASGRLPASRAASGLDDMVGPTYTGNGELIRPDGYHGWMFVGASLGLRYAEDDESQGGGPGDFHNVYIQPEAYDYFMEHGEFPEKTMLALETYETGAREPRAELTGGYFEDALAGFSMAIKDSDRFAESWGYVSFAESDTAKPFPRERCYDCHAEHAAVDNVFTQFYPMLRR